MPIQIQPNDTVTWNSYEGAGQLSFKREEARLFNKHTELSPKLYGWEAGYFTPCQDYAAEMNSQALRYVVLVGAITGLERTSGWFPDEEMRGIQRWRFLAPEARKDHLKVEDMVIWDPNKDGFTFYRGRSWAHQRDPVFPAGEELFVSEARTTSATRRSKGLFYAQMTFAATKRPSLLKRQEYDPWHMLRIIGSVTGLDVKEVSGPYDRGRRQFMFEDPIIGRSC